MSTPSFPVDFKISSLSNGSLQVNQLYKGKGTIILNEAAMKSIQDIFRLYKLSTMNKIF